MSDDDITPQPGTETSPPPVEPTSPPPGSTDSDNWEGRYKGSVKKIESLTLANRDLAAKLEKLTSEIEQQKSQLNIKDVERDVAVSERDKELKQLVEAKTALEKEATQLRALQMKVTIAKELGHPELIEIADRIPAVDDPEVMKEIMNDFWGFTEKQVKKREGQLLSGVTPPAGPGIGGDSSPATSQAWLDKINALPLGTPERNKAMNDYGDWLERENKK